MSRNRSGGQSLVEALLLSAALVLALFAPFDEGGSAATRVVEAIFQFFRGITSVNSIL